MKSAKTISMVASAFVFTLLATTASGQTYPTRPIRFIVPFAVGGAADIAARIIAPRLGESLNQKIVVDNRPGAGSIIGTDLVAKSAPDGYTMLLTNVAFGALPALHRKLPYDPKKDFATVSLVNSAPQVLLVHPSLPVKTTEELIALAKSRPGQINYASAGIGSGNHLNAELFKIDTGINIVHVPYQGGGPALTALLSGEVHVNFAGVPPSLPYIQSGKARVLAVTSTKRIPRLPDVPTLAETVLPGFEFSAWHGVLVRAGTSNEIIATLNRAINQSLVHPDIMERMANLGAEPTGSTPTQMATRIKVESEKWKKALKPLD
ncbi:MAG: tripartite tricarboxylate transporter substrate binding protein [Phycisphaerales bacterium]|nr:tripartite tricarboxylate transporter substrate binding protein [Phycisphaerales bacterium]